MITSSSSGESVSALDSLGVREVSLSRLSLLTVASAGFLCKTAVRVDNKLYYIKTGRSSSPGFSYLFPVSEMICYELGRLMGFNVAKYELWSVNADILLEGEYLEEYLNDRGYKDCMDINRELRDKGRILVNASESFVGVREQLVPAYDLDLEEFSEEELYNALISSGRFTQEYVDKMIVFDFLVCSLDRHLNNFGYISSGITTHEAPLYDHGDCLFSRYGLNYIQQWKQYSSTRDVCKPFGLTYEPLNWVDKNSLHNINLNINKQLIIDAVNRYSSLLGEPRARIIIETLLGRLNYVRGLYS